MWKGDVKVVMEKMGASSSSVEVVGAEGALSTMNAIISPKSWGAAVAVLLVAYIFQLFCVCLCVICVDIFCRRTYFALTFFPLHGRGYLAIAHHSAIPRFPTFHDCMFSPFLWFISNIDLGYLSVHLISDRLLHSIYLSLDFSWSLSNLRVGACWWVY